MKPETIIKQIATSFVAYLNCIKSNNSEWEVKHRQRIEELVKRWLPSGSGFDNGTQFDFDNSKPDKLVFTTSFHHMNENGYYDGWSEHSVIVTPSLAFGFEIRVTGRDRNDIKEYIAESFWEMLSREWSEEQLAAV